MLIISSPLAAPLNPGGTISSNVNRRRTIPLLSSTLVPISRISSSQFQWLTLSSNTKPNYTNRCSACLSSSSSSFQTSSPKTKLFVSGLSFRTTEESLRNAFKDFGELLEVNLVMDKIANRPRGFAFLRYATEDESEQAIKGMHGKFLDGRVIFVEVAKPRTEQRQDPPKQIRRHY